MRLAHQLPVWRWPLASMPTWLASGARAEATARQLAFKPKLRRKTTP